MLLERRVHDPEVAEGISQAPIAHPVLAVRDRNDHPRPGGHCLLRGGVDVGDPEKQAYRCPATLPAS